jgi:hypothetical protein
MGCTASALPPERNGSCPTAPMAVRSDPKPGSSQPPAPMHCGVLKVPAPATDTTSTAPASSATQACPLVCSKVLDETEAVSNLLMHLVWVLDVF